MTVDIVIVINEYACTHMQNFNYAWLHVQLKLIST